ncbi:hypothetical protein B0H14DRAFT_2793797 [Mycena olivaceomarginata]|nr:hypothetical protein B0H14DRAFT_3049640 [Mycena olivaceomarginata]KAJ7836573.1 hypothetical protein B0H14DRAFT_2793797 [Mycena olivaceomarginata]
MSLHQYLNKHPSEAPGHTGNVGNTVVGSSAHSQPFPLHRNIEEVQAFPTPLPSISQTLENNWTEAETAVFDRADPADDEWTDEESNQTGVGSRSKHKSGNRRRQHPRARRWIYTDRSPSPGAVEKIPEFPKGKTRSGRHFSFMELSEGDCRTNLAPTN